MFCPGCVIEFLGPFLVLQSSRRVREGWLHYFDCIFPMYVCVFVCVFVVF